MRSLLLVCCHCMFVVLVIALVVVLCAFGLFFGIAALSSCRCCCSFHSCCRWCSCCWSCSRSMCCCVFQPLCSYIFIFPWWLWYCRSVLQATSLRCWCMLVRVSLRPPAEARTSRGWCARSKHAASSTRQAQRGSNLSHASPGSLHPCELSGGCISSFPDGWGCVSMALLLGLLFESSRLFFFEGGPAGARKFCVAGNGFWVFGRVSESTSYAKLVLEASLRRTATSCLREGSASSPGGAVTCRFPRRSRSTSRAKRCRSTSAATGTTPKLQRPSTFASPRQCLYLSGLFTEIHPRSPNQSVSATVRLIDVFAVVVHSCTCIVLGSATIDMVVVFALAAVAVIFLGGRGGRHDRARSTRRIVNSSRNGSANDFISPSSLSPPAPALVPPLLPRL